MIRPLSFFARAAAAAVMLLGLAVVPAAAQEGALEAQVEQIAGTDIYLGAGTDLGLGAGTILAVLGPDGQEEIGRLRVIEATTKSSITTFVGSAFPVTRGTTLRLRITSAVPPTAGAVTAARASADADPAPRAPRGSSGPRVSGSLGLSFDARQTMTSWDEAGVEEVERTFSTPMLTLVLGVAELPGGIDFRTNLRASYRASTDDIVQPEDLVRVYSLQLAKDFGSVQAVLGRLANPYMPMSGYFDGALVHVGRAEGFGGGAAAGLRPSREDSGISDSIPKYSVFANYSGGGGRVLYDAAISFSLEVPKSNLLAKHRYFGLIQTLRAGSLLLRQSMSVDLNPTNDAWTVTQLLLGASLPIAGGLAAHAGYSLRQPYRVDQVVPITYRRDRANIGLSYSFSGSVVGADVTANDVKDDGLGTGWTYSGWFGVSETSLWRLGFTGNVSYWDRPDDEIVYVVGGLTRRFGPTSARLTYTYYRTEEGLADLTTHAGDLGVDFPLARRLRATVAAQIQRGTQLSGNAAYLSLWWAF